MKKTLLVVGLFLSVSLFASPFYGFPTTVVGTLSGFLFTQETKSETRSGTMLGPGTLLAWNTAGNLGSETTEPSTSNDVNVSSANLTFGSVSAAANGNRFGGNNWFDVGDTNPTTLAESVTGNDYIQFVVTPNSGYSFTPTSFDFIWDRSGTGPGAVTLRSSADGFTADLGSVTGIPSPNTAFNSITITGLSKGTVHHRHRNER